MTWRNLRPFSKVNLNNSLVLFPAALAFARAAFSHKINLSFSAETEIDWTVRLLYNRCQVMKYSAAEWMDVAQGKSEAWTWQS